MEALQFSGAQKALIIKQGEEGRLPQRSELQQRVAAEGRKGCSFGCSAAKASEAIRWVVPCSRTLATRLFQIEAPWSTTARNYWAWLAS